MLSTMHDIPLSIARILTYGSQIHGNTTVTSCDNGSKETTTFAEIGARAAALAHALRSELNVTDDQRVVLLCRHVHGCGVQPAQQAADG